MTTPCPKSFIKAGAASIVLRHALFDVDQHYKRLAESLEAAHKDMQAGGIERMELAHGERLVSEASAGVLKVMEAHNSWSHMLKEHGFEKQRNDEILEVIKEMGLSASAGSHLEKVMIAANWR
jgi:LPS sulfotransferase NodH